MSVCKSVCDAWFSVIIVQFFRFSCFITSSHLHISTPWPHHILTSSNAHTFISSHHTSSHLHNFTYSSIYVCAPCTCTSFFFETSWYFETSSYIFSLRYTSRYTSLRSRAIRLLALVLTWPAATGTAQNKWLPRKWASNEFSLEPHNLSATWNPINGTCTGTPTKTSAPSKAST